MNFKFGLLLFFFGFNCFANDGAYYASGNQLIPINETDVTVTKEVLTLVRKVVDGETYVYVTVDYTFFNSGKNKTILVGFEAPSPFGDVNGYPKNGAHPYISNFDVIMNNQFLKHKTAMVNTDNYYINGAIDAKTEAEVIGEDFNSNSPEFYYVYYFNANFKPGINTIKHTYRFNMSGSVLERYSFDYILTAANRWGNNQIDDFTLNIDMGNNQGFNISNTFFEDKNEWSIEDGRVFNHVNEYSKAKDTKFITNSGKISFKKKNFKPKGELSLYSSATYMKDYYDVFDYTKHNLPHNIIFYKEDNKTCTKSIDEDSYKILRNLPFAIKGYVFKTKVIQDYYLSQSWYKPNPNYVAKLETLSNQVMDWLTVVKSNTWE
ncbi:YARHG domain-containing protein [uncultured Olleya sp.]|uniref:YARHG domain-containing protein n=1 Tax=uncultured Olleya sp. TaxID=757243 RepID=UPI002596E936|nr:YARHG domain-containing protein [uncultured Olleya sp.]